MAFGAREDDSSMLKRRSLADLHAAFTAQPEPRQRETRERVQRLLEAEQARRQNVPSYLAQYHREIYG